jgi:hypothetical protein
MTAIFTAAPYFVIRLFVTRQSSVDNAHRKRKPHFSPWHSIAHPAPASIARHFARRSLERAGGWTDVTTEDRSPGGEADPLYAVWARRAPE